MNLKVIKPSEEEIKECIRKEDERLENDVNNLSYWFPKIKDCGIRVPKTRIFKIPREIRQCFFLEAENDRETIEEWFNKNVKSELKNKPYFIKNGTFSDKFSFNECCCVKDDMVNSLIAINWNAIMLSAGGRSEFVVREVIPYSVTGSLKIYNGLPLRPEYRVFYDFDERKVIGIVNYWDPEYVAPHLDRTDKLVFDHASTNIRICFDLYKDKVVEIVDEAMKEVDLTGKWSVDILREGILKKDGYWLIDMATAKTSAYWNKFKEK